MRLKILIISKYAWKSRAEKHKAIKDLMLLCPDIEDVEITFRKEDLGTPTVYVDGEGQVRISEKWFEETISRKAKAAGYTHAGFQFSDADGKKWGIKSGHRGTNYYDGDFFGEFWVKCNETSKRKYVNDEERFTYVVDVPHEIGHEFQRQGLTELYIHDFDYDWKINSIEEFYKQLRITKQSVIYTLFNRILDLTKIKALLIEKPMLPIKNFETVTQKFLSPNRHYRSGLHVGTDFAVPIGTPVYAPLNGYISTVFKNHKSLGNACYYHFSYNGKEYSLRVLHLSRVPVVKTYLKGEIIAYTGNTGDSSGPHLHLDLWRGRTINTAKVYTRQGVLDNLIDPYAFFKGIIT